MTSPDLNSTDLLQKPEILNSNQDPMPTQEERNNQLREEKLSNLLSQEIKQEDKEWLDYNDWSTQVKLDLADMILEDLATEMASFLRCM
jgi:DNA-nicking Smr family endonuclease